MCFLQAMAADVLFRGGVTEMARENALTTLTGLYRYAMESRSECGGDIYEIRREV